MRPLFYSTAVVSDTLSSVWFSLTMGRWKVVNNGKPESTASCENNPGIILLDHLLFLQEAKKLYLSWETTQSYITFTYFLKFYTGKIKHVDYIWLNHKCSTSTYLRCPFFSCGSFTFSLITRGSIYFQSLGELHRWPHTGTATQKGKAVRTSSSAFPLRSHPTPASCF